MIPTIGLMVCMIGVAVCAYVMLRALGSVLRSDRGRTVRIVGGVVAVVALGALAGDVWLGVDLVRQSNDATERDEARAAQSARDAAAERAREYQQRFGGGN